MMGTDKVVLTSSSILALTLGIAANGPADAALIVTQIPAGTSVDGYTFGPTGDPSGFTTGIASAGADFTLAGNSLNLVADQAGSTGCTTTTSCKLEVLQPGDVVDSTLGYQPSGYKISVTQTGDDYFGLDDTAQNKFGFLEVDFSTSTPTLVEYAFESSGGPAAIAEPASLSLFAVGAAAALAARRRRKQLTS